MWAHEEGGQPEHKAIERGEIRRTLSGAIADQELMLEQERLSCDPAHAARAEEFREGNEQMDRQEEQIAHELKLSRRPICTRLHHSGDSRQNLPIRHPHPSSPRRQPVSSGSSQLVALAVLHLADLSNPRSTPSHLTDTNPDTSPRDLPPLSA